MLRLSLGLMLLWLLFGVGCAGNGPVVAKGPEQRPNPVASPAAPLAAKTPEIALLVGKPAPGFTLPTLSGDMVALASLKGKAVLLTFFTTK